MGNLTKKVKKKKSRQAKAKFTSLVTTAMAVAFINATSSVYLREIYNVKTLLPSWGIAKKDIIFSVGDLMILNRDIALKILVDMNLLVAEQIRQVAAIALILVIVYMIGKSWFDRLSLLMFVGGLSGMLYYAFLFALLRWPSSLLSKDILVMVPTPVIVPIYMPVLLSALAFLGGAFLVFKKK